MKFQKYLEHEAIVEWKEKYIDYALLKKRIKHIVLAMDMSPEETVPFDPELVKNGFPVDGNIDESESVVSG